MGTQTRVVAGSWAAVMVCKTVWRAVSTPGVHLRQSRERLQQNHPRGHPMKLHPRLYKAQPSHRATSLRTSILAASCACATFFAASQSVAQTRIDRDIAYPAQDAADGTLQESPAPAAPAEAGISAPIPNVEEAGSVTPATNPLFSLAEDVGQSSTSLGSSSQSSSSTTAPAKPRATKTKSPHHGLGIALATVGTVALAVGIASYALGGIDICSNEKSGGCKEARDAGLVLMPVGGGVAFTGFYLVFHH